MRKFFFCSLLAACCSLSGYSQLHWTNVDSVYQPLPKSVHVYFTDEKIDTGMFRAFYVIADLKDKTLQFTVDTSRNRRLTPVQFYRKYEEWDNLSRHPLVVVNSTFFSFKTNKSVTPVIMNGRLVAYDTSITGKGKDSFKYFHPFVSAIGITKKRKADVAWTFTEPGVKHAYASQWILKPIIDSIKDPSLRYIKSKTGTNIVRRSQPLKKWKMQTAVGGGPVLLQNGEIQITNNEEIKFAGKAISDKHPRTAMGYTKDGKLIILVIQGRSESGGGATLTQEAQILKDLGCWEALNLDGGGSSCMLVNGKETIKPSDKEGERAVPAVFEIYR